MNLMFNLILALFSQLLELQKERDEVMRQYQKHVKELNLQLVLKEDKEQSCLSEIKLLQEKLYKKKEKSRELKRVLFILDHYFLMLQ